MCNACGFLCCAYDAFSGCGCDFCENSDCWDNEDFDDGSYDPFDGLRTRAHRFFCDSPVILRTPERKITASPRGSIAGVGTDGAASASASRLSYLLAPADPATDKGAHGDDRVHAPPAIIFESSEAAPPA